LTSRKRKPLAGRAVKPAPLIYAGYAVAEMSQRLSLPTATGK